MSYNYIVFVINRCAKKKKKKKRVWVKQWMQKREEFTHLRLLKCIQSCEPLDVINYLRMDYGRFQEILILVAPLIEKKEHFV